MSTGKFKSKGKGAKVKIAGDHDPKECNHKCDGKFIHYKPKTATEGKEMVKAMTQNGARYLIVPKREPIDTPAILPQSEMQRLKQQAHVVTYQDRIAVLEEAEKKQFELVEQSEKRRQAMQKLQQRNKIGGKLSKIEQEAKLKHQYLLQRSEELRKEQEDDVKKANGLILATKCMAIRNAQIAEKALIERQLAEEDKRLDMMMEQVRQKALREEEEKKKVDERKNQVFIKSVGDQVKENELRRLIEAERVEEESRLLTKALIAMQRDEAEKLQEKYRLQDQTKQELLEASMEQLRFKAIQKEEDRIADMRVQEFMKQKEEQEAKREEEARAIRIAKEHEIARLRAMQEKAQDQKAALDELNAVRAQEQAEREWRQKEKKEAQKRREQQEALREARNQQIDDIRRAQAIELARDEEEFHKVAKAQNELLQKERAEREKQKLARLCLREEILKQIDEKERQRINEIQEKFEMGQAIREENEIREMQVKDYVKKKIDKLRESALPEYYIKDIERHFKLD